MTVDADLGDTDLLGKVASDLQSDISIGSDAITGTLKYVTDYTGFSSVTEEQSGNYIALHFESDEDAVITVEVVGGHSGPSTLDDDGIIICRIESTSQSIKAIATLNGLTTTKTFSLTGVTLEEV